MYTHAKLLFVAAALTVAALPAPAHHSNSAYKVNEIITLEGECEDPGGGYFPVPTSLKSATNRLTGTTWGSMRE